MFACLSAFQSERSFETLDFTDMQVIPSNQVYICEDLYKRIGSKAQVCSHLIICGVICLQPEWWASNFSGAGVMNNYNRRAGDVWV